MFQVSNFFAYYCFPTELTFVGSTGNVNITLTKVGTPYLNNFLFKHSSGGWLEYTIGTPITVGGGLYVSFRGLGTQLSKDFNNYYNFQTTTSNDGRVNLRGNCNSLINNSLTLHDYCFNSLFKRKTSTSYLLITDATLFKLPSIELATACYAYMFGNYTNDSDNESTTPYSYLSSINPNLLLSKNITPSCYMQMFNQNRYLINGPSVLPATTLANNCYHDMFRHCLILSSYPRILPATELKFECYRAMFQRCGKITDIKISGLALAQRSIRYMFENKANSLSSIEVCFTDWGANENTSRWVWSVAKNGIFTCPTALGTNETIKRGTDYCPINWTVINK